MSKRFGRNQRRKMRERIAEQDHCLQVAGFWIREYQQQTGNIIRAHQSHRTYFGGKVCMNCGCSLGSPASAQECSGTSLMKQHRDELLEALEDTIAMARSLSDVQNAYIEQTVSDFTAGYISDLIARVKGGAL